MAVDVRVKDKAELNDQWTRLGQRDDHKRFTTELEPLIVSGSTKWELLRVVD